MAQSYVLYTGNGTTKNFTVSFSYISRNHVTVKLNNADALYPLDWQWVNDSTITFTNAPESGAAIEIYRTTPRNERLVDFQNGSILTEADLDLAHLQHFYTAQEISEGYSKLLQDGQIRIAAAAGVTYTDADQIIQAMTEEVLASELAADLQARITDIDLNAETILDVDTRLVITEENITLLGARNLAGSAFILDKDKIIVDSLSGETLATRLTQIQADYDSNVAAIASEASARATADSALASDITTLQTTVDGNTTSISTNATSIDGIEGKYTVKIDNNGYVSGYGLISTANNGTPTSEFTVLVDKFAIIDAAQTTGTPVVPFVVTGGVVYMQNVVIGGALIENASIGSAKISDLAASKLTAGNITASLGITTGSLQISSSGKIYSGKTTFATAAAGFFLGIESSTAKFKVGNADGSKQIAWDGSTFEVTGGQYSGTMITFPTSYTAERGATAPTPATCTMTMGTNRLISTSPGSGPDIIWLVGGDPSDYEVRMTTVSGTLNSGTTGTWVAMTSDRNWTKTEASSYGTYSYFGTLEIRRASDSVVVGSCDVEIRVTFSA